MKKLGIGVLLFASAVAACTARAPGRTPTPADVNVSDVPQGGVPTGTEDMGRVTLSGVGFAPKVAVAGVTMVPAGKEAKDAHASRTASAHLTITMSDASGLCSKPTSHPGTSEFYINVVQEGSVTPGTYVVPPRKNYPSRYGTARIKGWDAGCNIKTWLKAQSGSVTVTHVDANVVSGTFEFVFSSGPVTGSFSAPVCVPRDYQSLCPVTRCDNGSRVDEQTCTDAGRPTHGDYFSYCKKDEETGHVTSGMTLCHAHYGAPKCVAEVIDGKSRAACCPEGRTHPTEPGCVAFPDWYQKKFE